MRTLTSNLKVGVLAWTHWENNIPNNNSEKSSSFSIVRSEHIFDILNSMKTDTIVAFPHWDFEYQHFPSHSTRIFALLKD